MSTDSTRRNQELAKFEKQATRIAVGLVIAAFPLAMVAIALGSAEVFPYEYTVTVSLAAMLVPIGLALPIGATGGLYILGGWKVTPFGLVFTAGFAALVYALTQDAAGWLYTGTTLLAISGAAFFAAGTASARTPTSPRNTWGTTGSLAAGAATTLAGYLTGYWWLLLFGTMTVACALGALIGQRQAHRRKTTALTC